MARNELVPQDYCEMVFDYISGFRGLFPFTVNKITKYCIKKTKLLDEGDEEKIKQIVKESLETLCGAGYLAKCDEEYVEIKNVRDFYGFVMDDLKPMGKVSKEMIDKLNDIDQNTHYLG